VISKQYSIPLFAQLLNLRKKRTLLFCAPLLSWKTVLYSSLRSIAKSQKEKNVTLLRSTALCCAPLLSVALHCSLALLVKKLDLGNGEP